MGGAGSQGWYGPAGGQGPGGLRASVYLLVGRPRSCGLPGLGPETAGSGLPIDVAGYWPGRSQGLCQLAGGQGPGTGGLEGGLHNCTCQYQCPCGRRSSPVTATSVYIHRMNPSCLLPLWEALQDQQVDLTQAPFK